MQVLNQRRPLDSRFYLKQAFFTIKTKHTFEAARIDQHRVIRKLLPAHGVAATSDGDCFSGLPRVADDALALINRRGSENLFDQRGVELRMNVIDFDS